MKEFFKMTLATICGIAIFLVVTCLFFAISLVGMIASDSASTKVKDNSVFVIKLNGTISERAEADSPFNTLLGMGDMSAMGLDDLIASIRKAKDNENIKGIYLEGLYHTMNFLRIFGYMKSIWRCSGKGTIMTL
jgi:protease-4